MAEPASTSLPLMYVVVIELAENADQDAFPIVFHREREPPLGALDATRPHGLSREVASGLPGLWYCLHLANDPAQLDDLPISDIKNGQRLFLGPHILLVPISILNAALEVYVSAFRLVLAVCEDQLLDQVTVATERVEFLLPVAGFGELSDDLLAEHWSTLADSVAPDGLRRRPLSLSRDHHVAPSDIVRRLISRQLGDVDRAEPEQLTNLDSVSRALDLQILLAACATLEEEGVRQEQASERMYEQLRSDGRALKIPVVIGLPGVPLAYERRTYGARSPASRGTPGADELEGWNVVDDSAVELDAIEFITAHEAVSRTGLGLVLPAVPAAAWIALADLERHCRSAAPRPTVIAKMMRRLTASMEHVFTNQFRYAVTHASTISVHGNFPLGLLTLPGDTGPLLERAPIAYRPTLPLTRAVQSQLLPHASNFVGQKLRVLVVECIPESDPVGHLSRIGWDHATEEFIARSDVLAVHHVSVGTEQDIRREIGKRRPHVLVISAHGVLRGGDFAGIEIGGRPSLGIGLGPLPPLVVVSACHVAPRGTGAVSIADLLIREGADAVLGTQVPVDVRRNAMLMIRFFLYIALAMSGEEHFADVLQVWQHVQSSNAINDILYGSRGLYEFGVSDSPSGRSVIAEFMSEHSVGRLRQGHLHKDTEAVLVEIAASMGLQDKVENWLTSPGYVPESFFYAFVGRPEIIRVGP